MGSSYYIAPLGTGGGSTPSDYEDEDYVRPDWPVMPDASASPMFAGAHTVFPDGNNWMAFRFTTSTGLVNVDWGDGTSNTYASGTVIEKNFAYASYAGSDCSRGYRVAIVTVTAATGNLTGIDLNRKHSAVIGTGTNFVAFTGWLDIQASGTSVSSLIVSTVNSSRLGHHTSLEIFEWYGTNAVTSGDYMFNQLMSLRRCKIYTALMSTFNSMFSACGLAVLPEVSFASLSTAISATLLQQFAQSMPNLRRAVVDFSGRARVLSSSFAQNPLLSDLRLSGTGGIQQMQNTFNGNRAMRIPPTITSTALTNISGAFGDTNLSEWPVLTTNLVTNFSQLYAGSFLPNTPCKLTIDMTSATSISSVVSGSQGIEELEIINMGTGVTTAANGAIGGPSYTKLRKVTGLRIGALAAGPYQPFSAQNAIQYFRPVGTIAKSTSLLNCKLDATELNWLATNWLADLTALPTQTFTVTGCPGAATFTQAIATAKNWTVVV